ncbi:hypothetical protein ACS0TY_013690 [Phlomoides rotata]
MPRVGEDDSQPSSCKTLLDGCGAVNHASVPKKLRSAIKKRGRESITITFPIPIPKKKHHIKLNTRKGHITKDEEEVAETLYALAGMFTHRPRPRPKLDSINEAQGEESRKTGSKITAHVLEPTTPGFRSDLLCRQIDLQQGGVSGVQYDKCKGPPTSETHKSCSRFPAWFESTILSSQPRVTENSITPVSVESKNSWKRCTAHVYISRLIKVLQISQRKESLPEKPTQLLTACGGAELQLCGNQIAGRNSGASSSGIQKDSSETQNDILVHKRPIQDQQQLQQATETSALCSFKQGYDFLCLGAGERGDEARIQYHAPYMQSQDHSAMLFPLPQNGHFYTQNSALPSQQQQQQQQQQVPQYHHTSFTARTGQEQQLLQTNYINRSGGRGESSSASVLNYAHALFPHLNAALAAKYQHQLLPLNNMLPLGLKRQQYHLPLGFERNPPHLQLHNLLNR